MPKALLISALHTPSNLKPYIKKMESSLTEYTIKRNWEGDIPAGKILPPGHDLKTSQSEAIKTLCKNVSAELEKLNEEEEKSSTQPILKVMIDFNLGFSGDDIDTLEPLVSILEPYAKNTDIQLIIVGAGSGEAKAKPPNIDLSKLDIKAKVATCQETIQYYKAKLADKGIKVSSLKDFLPDLRRPLPVSPSLEEMRPTGAGAPVAETSSETEERKRRSP